MAAPTMAAATMAAAQWPRQQWPRNARGRTKPKAAQIAQQYNLEARAPLFYYNKGTWPELTQST